MRLTQPRIHSTYDHGRGGPRWVRLSRACAVRSHNDVSTPRISSAAVPRRRASGRSLLLAAEVTVLVFVLAGSAHAEGVAVLALAGSVDQVLNNIRDWLMGILAALATVFLTVGGVRRVAGGGDPGEQEKAKTCFKSAAIGYGLAALAPLAVTVLKGIVGA